MKKVISLVMSFVMLLSITAGVNLSAYADDATSGKCGDSAYWNYDEDTKTLTISGSGRMDDYYFYYESSVSLPDTPWVKFCHNIKKISIGNNIISIGNWAFGFCSSLTNVTIPDSVTSIGDAAFVYCSNLTSITIPNSVTNIGKGAFAECSSLVSVVLPNSVKNLGDALFYHCGNLINVTLPDKLTIIGIFMFSCCYSLKNIIIPSCVKSIGVYAFSNCNNLESVTIPDSTTKIIRGAFAYCSSLSNIYYKGTEEQWEKISIEDENICLTNAKIYFVEKYIDGYDFLNDSYNFKNCGADISKKYFTTLFGTEKGKLLYRNCHNFDGLCFGFAYTTGAILNNCPNVNTIAIRTGLVTSDLCKNIRDIQYQRYSINKFSGMFIGENFLSIEDYIKYAFIYQLSKTFSESSIWYSDKIEDNVSSPTKLLRLVKNSIDNNNINISISIMNQCQKKVIKF